MGGWEDPDDNTWEPIGNLECHELIEEYEKKHGGDDKEAGGSKRKAAGDASEPKSKSAKKPDTRPKGFARGLTAEKIIGATNDPGELYFLIKWKGSDEADLSCQGGQPENSTGGDQVLRGEVELVRR